MVLAAMPQLANKVHFIHWQVRTGDMLAWYSSIEFQYCTRMGSTLPNLSEWCRTGKTTSVIPYADYSKIVKLSFETRMQPGKSISRSNNFGDLLPLKRRKRGKKKKNVNPSDNSWGLGAAP